MKVPEPRKLPSGNYFIQMRLGGVSVPVTASSAKECRRIATAIKAEHAAGRRSTRPKDASLLTLHDAIDAYIKSREHTLSPSTTDGYRRIQKKRFQAAMQRPMAQITDWQAICDAEAQTVAPKTLKNAWGLIASVLAANRLTVPRITFPAKAPKPRGWLEPEEIASLVSAVAGTDDALPVCLALSSLRRSEIAGLDWQSIDLRRRTILVTATVVPSQKGFVRRDATKTNGSARTVPIMIPELLAALESVPPEERTGRVLHCSPQTICRRIDRVCAAAGLPQVGTHGLRHSFASLAYHLGLSELETMEIGGWSDAGTMRKIYTHLARADRLKAENKMAAFYKTASKMLMAL